MSGHLGDIKRETFLDHVAREEPFEYIIYGHLWVEAELGDLLDACVRQPEALARVRLGLEQKFAIIKALSGLPLDFDVRPYRFLGELRNRFAHRLDAQVDMKDQLHLLAFIVATPPSEEELPFPAGLRGGIVYLHHLLETYLQARRDLLGGGPV